MFVYLSFLSTTVNFFKQMQVNSDPVFRIRIHLIRFQIKHFRLNTDPYPIRIQGFDDQKMKKNS
jgi:hypothetical protein